MNDDLKQFLMFLGSIVGGMLLVIFFVMCLVFFGQKIAVQKLQISKIEAQMPAEKEQKK